MAQQKESSSSSSSQPTTAASDPLTMMDGHNKEAQSSNNNNHASENQKTQSSTEGMGHSGFEFQNQHPLAVSAPSLAMLGGTSSNPTAVAVGQQLQNLGLLLQQPQLPQQPMHQQQQMALQHAHALLQQLQHQQLQQQLQPHHQQQQQHLLYPPGTSTVTHNLIPTHLQDSAEASSLNGSPGHPSALILPPVAGLVPSSSGPLLLQQQQLASSSLLQQLQLQQLLQPVAPPQPILTVQDRPMVAPTYNGVNPNYPGLRMVHSTPPIFCVEQFLTAYECDFLIHNASDAFERAPVVGKGVGEVSPSRTSSTCYLAREDVPDYMRKVSLLTGKPIEHCELPQVGRYMPTEQYLQHFDAFDLSNEDGRRFANNGGQRVITVLVYLNDVNQGGETFFPALNLKVQPRKGMALVFFPATVDGLLDKMALHAAQPAIDVKYVSQVWIRQANYNGQPSKRLAQTLGTPFHQQHPQLQHPQLQHPQLQHPQLQQQHPQPGAVATAAASPPTDMTGVVSMFP